MQQELKARGKQLQAAEQRMRDALEEVQKLQSALSGVRGELESGRQISNQREADTMAAKERAKLEVAAAQKEAQEAAQQLDALQIAAESLRTELEAVMAELTVAKAAGAADAERMAEQQKLGGEVRSWLEDELERLKAQQEKEHKARQVVAQLSFVHGGLVPWLHI